VTNVVPVIENSDNWIKFLPTEKYHFNIIITYCTIIILKTKKNFKPVKKNNKYDYKLTFSHILFEKLQE
jgi:UDP-3-O-acyl-N-acetylglucosamine deacetylase